MKRNLLLYFVKYPQPGKVKTRLAKTLGDTEAAERYRHLAEDNLKAFAPLHAQGLLKGVIAFDPADKRREIENWLSSHYEYLPQEGEDLGERLTHAFSFAFNQGYKRVVALGSDTLKLNSNHIRQSLDVLERYDVVLGPAGDGGYYLIGLSAARPLLFKNIPWSTPGVLSATLQQIKKEKLSHYLLDTLEDLDELKTRNKI